jgi:acyl-ACP thioesterase
MVAQTQKLTVMKSQTFDVHSSIGKQFLSLAKRFCKNFQNDVDCFAEIDTEAYIFHLNSEKETITVIK